MISRVRPLLLVIALGAVGCSDHLVNSRPEAIRGELWGNRALWNAQNLDDYRYTSQVACCIVGEIRQVRVLDGKVVEVRDERGNALPREEWSRVFTVDEIFDQLAEAQSRNEHTEASYHRSLGYPVNVVIGSVSDDAGIRMLFSDLTRIHPSTFRQAQSLTAPGGPKSKAPALHRAESVKARRNRRALSGWDPRERSRTVTRLDRPTRTRASQ